MINCSLLSSAQNKCLRKHSISKVTTVLFLIAFSALQLSCKKSDEASTEYISSRKSAVNSNNNDKSNKYFLAIDQDRSCLAFVSLTEAQNAQFVAAAQKNSGTSDTGPGGQKSAPQNQVSRACDRNEVQTISSVAESVSQDVVLADASDATAMNIAPLVVAGAAISGACGLTYFTFRHAICGYIKSISDPSHLLESLAASVSVYFENKHLVVPLVRNGKAVAVCSVGAILTEAGIQMNSLWFKKVADDCGTGLSKEGKTKGKADAHH